MDTMRKMPKSKPRSDSIVTAASRILLDEYRSKLCCATEHRVERWTVKIRDFDTHQRAQSLREAQQFITGDTCRDILTMAQNRG